MIKFGLIINNCTRKVGHQPEVVNLNRCFDQQESKVRSIFCAFLVKINKKSGFSAKLFQVDVSLH